MVFMTSFTRNIQEALKKDEMTVNSVWHIFLLKPENIFFISGFLWICEVLSTANRCDKIPVWSAAHMKSSRYFSFLEVIPGKKKHYGSGIKYFRSRRRGTVPILILLSLKKKKKKFGNFSWKQSCAGKFRKAVELVQ